VRRALAIGALIVLAAVAAFLAFRGRTPAVRREPGLNVLLITIDTLRADALGSYGNQTVRTPIMDGLAKAGVRFDNAHAHNVVTLPSHANILSGRYPMDHGVRENAGFRFPANAETLATILRARGYRTGAFVSAFPLDSRFGLTRGFDEYDDRYGDAESHIAFRMQERAGSITVAAAKRWIESSSAEPYFCWIHLYDPHFPYMPPEPFASEFRDNPYLGEVSATDAALKEVLDPIVGAGGGRTFVALTADHGESLGENGEETHGIFAYEASLRVPLILYQPRLLDPAVVAQPVRHVDLMPTILDAIGIDPPQGLRGVSLLNVAAGGPAPPAISYFEALSAMMNRGWAPLQGVLRGTTKYIDLPIPELYDVAADAGESRNLIASQPAQVREMQTLLGTFKKDDPGVGRAQESAETLERLRSLGYVTSAPPGKKVYKEDDDPKRLIELDAGIHAVVTRFQAGDLDGALALCNDIVKRRPDMPLTLLYLAFLERARGNLDGAVDAGRRALALSAADPDVAALVGVYLSEAGHAQEAARVLEPIAAQAEPDLDVVMAYGVALAYSGKPDGALAAFDRARTLDPSNGMALVNRGTVFLREGDLVRAREDFEAALRLDPSIARAHNSLGVIAARNKHFDEAIARWREAVALDPNDYQTLYNLGMLLLEQGRPADARPFLEHYAEAAPPALEARDIARVRQWLAQQPR
jgi:arylsulfatase A-like enzyme/Flp pilus assembly protein TadD